MPRGALAQNLRARCSQKENFNVIQTYRIFHFLRRLFAKHQTLSS